MNIVYIGLGIVFLLLIFSKANKKRKRRHIRIQVDETNCTGCQRCVKRCRRQVLNVQREGNAIRAMVENPNKCSACGDCIGVCKFNALKFIPQNS